MPKLNVPEGYYTVTQAAQIVGLSSKTVRFHIEQGNLEAKSFNVGSPSFYRLISQESLDAFRKKREPKDGEDHLYEIICISCGKTDVLYSTRSLMELSRTYARMVENDHKLVRIRLDGEPLLIFESDKLGFTYHPRTKKGFRYGKSMERSQGSASGYLPRHDESRVQHGQESAVLRSGACGQGKADMPGGPAPKRKQKEPVPAVPESGEGAVQSGPETAGREELPGVPARPGRKRRLTDEERRLKAREKMRRYRAEHPEKVKGYDRQYYETHKEQFREKNRRYVERHKEQHNAYLREYRRKRKEAKNDAGTESE